MEAVPKEIQEARERLRNRMGAVVRLSRNSLLQAKGANKGLGRRVKKVTNKSNQEESKLKVTLKNLNCQPIDMIQEVNFFPTDGDVYHFNKAQGISCGLLFTFSSYQSYDEYHCCLWYSRKKP